MMLDDPSRLHRPTELVADFVTGAISAGWLGASVLDYIHGLEGVISGALVIVLLALRIRAHFR